MGWEQNITPEVKKKAIEHHAARGQRHRNIWRDRELCTFCIVRVLKEQEDSDDDA